MNIINNQNIITNNQISRILKLTKFRDIECVRIIILENRFDIFKKISQTISIGTYITFMFSYHCEGYYVPLLDEITIKLYNQKGNNEDKRLYGMGVILHELKHRDDLMLSYKTNEESADKYAKDFLNINSMAVKDILKLKDEWEIEEF